MEDLLIEVNGFIWPASDAECHAVVFDTTADLEHAYAHCKDFRQAVQAGGNCGVWPKAMAGKFAAVYTFEPDPVNFYCLSHNVLERNVFKFNAALGNERALIDLDRMPHNIGAHQVAGKGIIPTLSIDDLGLDACDLIYLDIEGFELKALRGAWRTIRRCKPVIAFEDKGLSVRYGTKEGEAEQFLASVYGYRVVERVNRDVVMAI